VAVPPLEDLNKASGGGAATPGKNGGGYIKKINQIEKSNGWPATPDSPRPPPEDHAGGLARPSGGGAATHQFFSFIFFLKKFKRKKKF
jgi:hypothetical protein